MRRPSPSIPGVRPVALYEILGRRRTPLSRQRPLLYLGISNSPELRWRQHAEDKPWWDGEVRVKRVVAWFPDEATALAAEERAIKLLRPRYNKEHNWGNPDRVDYQLRVPNPRRAVQTRAGLNGDLPPWPLAWAAGTVLAFLTVPSGLPALATTTVMLAGTAYATYRAWRRP